jgi:hypothetical protein
MKEPDTFFLAFAGRPRPASAGLLDAVNGHPERERARDLLSKRRPSELSVHDLRDVVGGNLGLLTPEAFLYFLPAFLAAIDADYPALTVIAYELVDQLAPPARGDVVEDYERLRRNVREGGADLPEAMVEMLRSQALQLVDSGMAQQRFAARFGGIAPEEARAILTFLRRLRDRYGADFPGGAVEKAFAYWDAHAAARKT